MPQTIRALVIHHDREMRHRLATGLAECGYETFQAVDPTDGLALMCQARPDLIFLEVDADRDEDWDTFSHIRLFTDVPVLLLADQPLSPVRQALCAKNAAVLVQPISIEKTIVAAKAFCKPSAALSPYSERRQKEKWRGNPLQVLGVSHVLAIDRALQEIGSYGEVRLVVHRGRLRFLAKLKTETIELEPAISK